MEKIRFYHLPVLSPRACSKW